MKNTFGDSVAVTLFGESHGPAVGAVLDGLAPGLAVDEDFITRQLSLRKPFGRISTARREEDAFEILSGVFEGKTTGTPVCIVIRNQDTRSRDYSATRPLARPGHADYTAHVKYHGFEDYRGGGHFSGRITTGLVAAGAIAIDALRHKGIRIGTHIARCGGISDRGFGETETASGGGASAEASLDRISAETFSDRTSAEAGLDTASEQALADRIAADITALGEKQFAVLDEERGAQMRAAIEAAAAEGDSVGGILETMVTGLPAGVGEPWFDTLEGRLAHMLYSIPAVKGVEFGAGFDLADARGSVFNDPFYMADGSDEVRTRTNHNGGINGGISNGMPLLFRCMVKPTPSISRRQETVNFLEGRDSIIEVKGRHDPAIVHRARVVADSVTALTLCDMLALRYGTDWLAMT